MSQISVSFLQNMLEGLFGPGSQLANIYQVIGLFRPITSICLICLRLNSKTRILHSWGDRVIANAAPLFFIEEKYVVTLKCVLNSHILACELGLTMAV